MEITKIKIEELKPYGGNAKKHPPEQVEQIKESIRYYGMNDPIAIDENNVVIEGHGRLMALKELGYEDAECIRIEGLTEEQKNAYRLVHNKLTMNTDFDFGMLEEELKRLDGFGVDVDKFGFDGPKREEKERKERKDLSDQINEIYEVIIECGNETEQQEAFERLSEEGYVCRVLTL